MHNMSYTTVSNVLDSWDTARRHSKDFEAEFGELLINRFVEIQPHSKEFYKDDAMMKRHADGIVGLFDSITQMLGPDMELIEEILTQVGERHAKMKISPSLFPFLGESLIWALEQKLGSQFTAAQREAWEEVYDAVSDQIVAEIVKA